MIFNHQRKKIIDISFFNFDNAASLIHNNEIPPASKEDWFTRKMHD